jgi:hypothetical protein
MRCVKVVGGHLKCSFLAEGCLCGSSLFELSLLLLKFECCLGRSMMSWPELWEERKVVIVYQILILFGLMCNVFQVSPNINIKGVSAKMQKNPDFDFFVITIDYMRTTQEF